MDDGQGGTPDGDGLRERARRLRWRMSGAWQLPVFAVCTVAGTVSLHLLPVAGQDTDLVGAFLLAGFANLIVLAALAPLGGLLVRRARPELPTDIARDRAGSVLLLGLLGLLALLGGLHHSSVVAADDADARQLAAARSHLRRHGTDEYVRNEDHANVWKQADFLYRTCFPGRDPDKHLCLFVDLSQTPPRVARDRDQQPNSVVAGEDNPGRIGR